MMNYIFLLVFICLFIFIFYLEKKEVKLLDFPDCYRTLNYCSSYNDKIGIKYIEKELKDMTITDSCNVILDTLDITKNLVYWRQCFIITTYIVIAFYLLMTSLKVYIPIYSYVILFLLSFTLSYFSKSYYDFHYLNHFYKMIENATNNIKNKGNQ